MAGDEREAEAALTAAGLPAVSRETINRLTRFVTLLTKWQRVKNLVGPSALDEIWTRHIADSAQLLTVAPSARRWLDLGSGAGFPGLIVAALLADDDGAEVHLVESNAGKCAFLREAARTIEVPAVVHQGRIEDVVAEWSTPIDAISARGLAPMAQLAEWVAPLAAKGTVAYLHKGLDFDSEWAATPHRERFDLIQHKSRIGSGVIAELRPPATTDAEK
jgi:16S rRNA (guanine527-N7)-methyltransferase